jgi:hypothetical protein
MRRTLSRGATLCAVACAAALGCGGDGTTRVSGKVNFKGAPVPAGKVYFIPKGGTGATGFADIKNGTYDTGSAGGRGAPGGPVTIAVEGFDPTAKDAKEKSEDVTAKVLFARHELAFDVPAGSATTKDIDVPAEAAKGPVAPKGPPGSVVP